MTPNARRVALQRGRIAFGQQAWRDAYARLSAADHLAPLEGEDLERLAVSAYLIGHDEASADAWVRAHEAFLRAHDTPRAVRCVFWMILELLATGEWARAGGWLATGLRLLDEGGYDCPERGLLMVLLARRHLKEGNAAAADEMSGRAAALGNRFDDPELKALGRLAVGLAHARRGDASAAVALFDEVMVAVTCRGISPIGVGTVYCAVIEACYEIVDIGRAREWTTALSRWCTAQPDLVPFRGHCLVHRAETMRLSGAWSDALAEAGHACGMSRPPRQPGDAAAAEPAPPRGYPVGAAFYEVAEVCRLRGRLADAEEAYRQASRHGRSPEPGLALLRLAEGRAALAATSILRVLDEQERPLARIHVLAACVEIMIAVPDLATASAAVEELSAMTARLNAPFLRAVSWQARGALLLADGKPHDALRSLRSAWMEWQAIEVPYEAARVRRLMGLCRRALGDEDAAEMEFDAARRVFLRLEAVRDVEQVTALLASRTGMQKGGLTPRELEVIRLLAAGLTNRAIARDLAISERTVDRHVSNILTKLDLPSRSAATAYAYEHRLV